MNVEQAEAIVSDPAGATPEDLAAARAVLGIEEPGAEIALEEPILELAIKECAVNPIPVQQTLTDTLARMEKEAPSPADKAIFNELAVIVGEAKMRFAQVAKKVENDDGHIAHAIIDYFRHL